MAALSAVHLSFLPMDVRARAEATLGITFTCGYRTQLVLLRPRLHLQHSSLCLWAFPSSQVPALSAPHRSGGRMDTNLQPGMWYCWLASPPAQPTPQDAQGNTVSLRPQSHLAALEASTKLTASPFSVPWMLKESARIPCLAIQTLLANFFSGRCTNFLQVELGFAAS